MITTDQAYNAKRNATPLAVEGGSYGGTIRKIEDDGETVLVLLYASNGYPIGWFDTLDVTRADTLRVPAGEWPNRFRWAYRGAIANAASWRKEGRPGMAQQWLMMAARLREGYIAERRALVWDLAQRAAGEPPF